MRVYDRAINQDEVALIYAGDLEQKRYDGRRRSCRLPCSGVMKMPGRPPTSMHLPRMPGMPRIYWALCRRVSFPSLLPGSKSAKPTITASWPPIQPVPSWSPTVGTFSTGSFRIYGRLVCWRKFTSLVGRDGYQWRRQSFQRTRECLINGETNQVLAHAGNGKGPDLRVDRWNGLSTLGFDGQSQYLRVDDSSVFDFGEDATIFVVAKGDTLADWRPILSKRGEDGVGWQFRKDNTRLRDFHCQGHDWKRWSARGAL